MSGKRVAVAQQIGVAHGQRGLAVVVAQVLPQGRLERVARFFARDGHGVNVKMSEM